MSYMRNLTLLCAASLMLGGCASSGEKEYENKGRNNFHIQSSVEEARGRATFLYIYDVNDKCEKEYLGYIRLKPDTAKLEYSLPESKLLLVKAEFVLDYARNASEYLVQTRSGQDYYADVRFKGSMFKFVLAEGHGGARRAVDYTPRLACKIEG